MELQHCQAKVVPYPVVDVVEDLKKDLSAAIFITSKHSCIFTCDIYY